ncbi:MAG: type I-E CRISPR-associated protein Cas7/Cse4/CasC [bacterium]
MLIEIHMLQNHAPSNLNRDDTGSPKDCIFGGVRRSRISSQCLKRSIRKSESFSSDENIKDYLGLRTRQFPSEVMKVLNNEPDNIPKALLEQISRALPNITKKVSKKETDETGSGATEPQKVVTNSIEQTKENDQLPAITQIVFLTNGEIEGLARQIKSAFKENADDFKLAIALLDPDAKLNKTENKKAKMKVLWLIKHLSKAFNPMTVDVALFGRMTTSEAFPNVQASIQVAHAISTNKMEHEFDYFTAVDDLNESEEIAGAGMIGDVEFNSACYYKYFTLDYDGLVKNLAGSEPPQKASKEEKEQHNWKIAEAHRVAALTVEAFLNSAVFTSPSGKQNSFAAHQLPDAILVEVREKKIPVSYANAFIKPAQTHGETDLMEDSLQKFVGHVKSLTKKFSLESRKRLWFTTSKVNFKNLTEIEKSTTLDEPEECTTLKDLLDELKKVLSKE